MSLLQAVEQCEKELKAAKQRELELLAVIRELREAVQHAQKQPYPFGHLELFDKVLTKTEHHNSRALEKMLLEARIEELEDLGNTIGFGSTTFLSRIAERKSKYELL